MRSSRRQRYVLDQVAAGRFLKDIAVELRVTPPRVRQIRDSAMKREDHIINGKQVRYWTGCYYGPALVVELASSPIDVFDETEFMYGATIG